MRISDWSSDGCSSDLIGELSRGYATDRKGLLPSASRRRRDLESRDGIDEVTQARLIVGGQRGRPEHRDGRRDVLPPLLALLRGHAPFGSFRARDLRGGNIRRRAAPLKRPPKSPRGNHSPP